ncbi:MAG: hypothetical protein HZB34_13570 [Nitrospirae bacterium]|jgi:hypothetical protein|nr:hypothetical protein [Nitrospirota bacterium]
MNRSLWVIAALAIFIGGCSSSGTLGIVTKSTADPASLLRTGRAFTELGPVKAEVCRHFVLAIIPWGKSDFGAAVDKALVERGGDALLNVTVETSLYGFIPVYNVYSFTCTTVQGIAVKFE